MRDLTGAVGFAKQRVGRSAGVALELCRDRGWGVRVDADTVIPAGCIVFHSSRVGFSGYDSSVRQTTFCVKAGTIQTADVVRLQKDLIKHGFAIFAGRTGQHRDQARTAVRAVGVAASQRDEFWTEASEAASDTSPGRVVDEE